MFFTSFECALNWIREWRSEICRPYMNVFCDITGIDDEPQMFGEFVSHDNCASIGEYAIQSFHTLKIFCRTA